MHARLIHPLTATAATASAAASSTAAAAVASVAGAAAGCPAAAAPSFSRGLPVVGAAEHGHGHDRHRGHEGEDKARDGAGRAVHGTSGGCGEASRRGEIQIGRAHV